VDIVMNILVTLDSNYIYPLSVMLHSLAANCPGSRIDLYVVYASLTEDDFSRMESALGGSDHEVHRIKVDDAIFSGFPVLEQSDLLPPAHRRDTAAGDRQGALP
jgi:lipopolysaccharide biosynthesis glycosyltransferase